MDYVRSFQYVLFIVLYYGKAATLFNNIFTTRVDNNALHWLGAFSPLLRANQVPNIGST